MSLDGKNRNPKIADLSKNHLNKDFESDRLK
jgi:hypothetical protein